MAGSVIVRALARMFLLLVLGSASVFAIVDSLPGDAAQARAGGRASAAEVDRTRAEFGLDLPVWQRFGEWLGAIAHGDLGSSWLTGRPVAQMIGERLAATAVLGMCALLVTVPAMVLGGWLVGRRSGGTSMWATTFAAVPQVVIAALLIAVFAGVLGWLPAVSLIPAGGSPLSAPEILPLPVLAVSLPSAAFGAVLLSGAIADVTCRPHVVDARLRGISEWLVFRRHVLPFVAASATRVLAVLLGGFVAGTALVETVFGYAGLGELLVGAIATRDSPVVQAIALLAVAVVLAVLLVADLLAVRADPRRVRR